MNAKKTINSITKLQSIGILLIVIIHGMPHRSNLHDPVTVEWIRRFIPSFAMPLFVFLSGYLFIMTNLNRNIVYSKFVLAKLKRLIVPYLMLSTVGYIIKLAMPQHALRSITPGITGFIRNLLYPWTNPIILFWFIPTLFLIFLIAPLFKKIVSLGNITIALAVLVVLYFLNVYVPIKVSFMNITGVLFYILYFYLGILVSYYFKDHFRKLDSWYIVLFTLALLVLANCVTFTFAERHFDVLVALIGIAAAISLAHFIDKHKPTLFKSFDGYYYQIFLLSWFPQVSVRLLYQMKIINYGITIILMILTGLYIPVLITKIVEKYLPRFRIIIGRI